MRSQLADLDRQVASEAQNILRSLSNTAKAAQLRDDQLVAALNRLKAESSRVGEKEVELRALEREAAAQRDLLESYLARYREATSRRDGNYLPVDARIFSRAVVPLAPYFPKIIAIAASTFAASILIMVLATLLRELFSGRAMRPAAGASLQPAEKVSAPKPSSLVETSPLAAKPDVASRAPSHGEMSVHDAAEMLIAGGASRALFVSPEGDAAAASAVLVARSVADAGLRVVLVDLTATGAASRPMLDNNELPGITDLLAGNRQIADVIHTDHYSDSRIIPVGSADPRTAMRAVERLPSIMDTLGRIYDVVIVECGPTGAGNIRRLVSEGTEILLSVLEPAEEVLAARDDLASVYEGLTLVTPGGGMQPMPPDRSAAA
jgi:Mrp family chromosome partitioning ATPase